jgi:hypothetical protein
MRDDFADNQCLKRSVYNLVLLCLAEFILSGDEQLVEAIQSKGE